MAALPFSRLEAKVAKPLGQDCKIPESIGYQIRKRRLELGLDQADLQVLFGVSHNMIGNWERNIFKPSGNHRPKLVKFLGYVPWPLDLTKFGGRLEQARLLKGLSMDELAKLIKHTKIKISRMERHIYLPKPDDVEKLKQVLGDF